MVYGLYGLSWTMDCHGLLSMVYHGLWTVMNYGLWSMDSMVYHGLLFMTVQGAVSVGLRGVGGGCCLLMAWWIRNRRKGKAGVHFELKHTSVLLSIFAECEVLSWKLQEC